MYSYIFYITTHTKQTSLESIVSNVIAFVSLRMVIESQLPDGRMVSLGIPVSDCYYTGTMMDGSGTVAISQCNNDTVKSFKQKII